MPWRAVKELEKSLFCRQKSSRCRFFSTFKKKFGLFPRLPLKTIFFRFSRFQNRGVLQQNHIARPDPERYDGNAYNFDFHLFQSILSIPVFLS